MKKKPIVISMGEPSGISSEILIKTWINRKKKNYYLFLLLMTNQKLNLLLIYLNLMQK